MKLLTPVRIIAVVCAGLFAGILLGDRAGATYARPQLSPSSFVQFQQIQHACFVRMMPPLILTAIFAGFAWLLLSRRRWKSAEFWLVAAGTAGVLFCLLLTRAVNVPINEQLMTWSITEPPADVRELWAPWERAHSVRTPVAVAAFLLEVVALTLSGKPFAPSGESESRLT